MFLQHWAWKVNIIGLKLTKVGKGSVYEMDGQTKCICVFLVFDDFLKSKIDEMDGQTMYHRNG